MSALDSNNILLLPLRKGHQCKTSTRDQRPVLWEEDRGVTDKEHVQSKKLVVCGVCNEHTSRYTCPRCSLQYCSVACYRLHRSQSEDDLETNNESQCAEEFYRGRVEQILDLEVKEKKDETNRMLNRFYQEPAFSLNMKETAVNGSGLSNDELLEVLVALENDDEAKVDRLLASSQKLRGALTRDLQQENLHEWFLDPWFPFWKTELIKSSSIEQTQDQLDLIFGKSLDEHLVALAPFSQLWPSGKALPELQFNAIDILYGIAWTLRLFHGPSNAKDIADQAVATLIGQASSVLLQDTRFASLEEVLSSACAASTQSFEKNSGCNTTSDVLLSDIACICQHDRMVSRCFIEAIGLVKAAKRRARQEQSDQSTAMLKRVQKKLEFYASWTRERRDIFPALSCNLNAWVAQWTVGQEHGAALPSERLLRCNTGSTPISLFADGSRERVLRLDMKEVARKPRTATVDDT